MKNYLLFWIFLSPLWGPQTKHIEEASDETSEIAIWKPQQVKLELSVRLNTTRGKFNIVFWRTHLLRWIYGRFVVWSGLRCLLNKCKAVVFDLPLLWPQDAEFPLTEEPRPTTILKYLSFLYKSSFSGGFNFQRVWQACFDSSHVFEKWFLFCWGCVILIKKETLQVNFGLFYFHRKFPFRLEEIVLMS